MERSLLIFYNVQPEPCDTEPASPALRKKQTELLAIGDRVLSLLPAWVQDVLSESILEEPISRLRYGDDWEKLTPARVRTALSVEETAIALQGLVFGFSQRNHLHQVHQVAVLNEQKGILSTGKRGTFVRHIVERVGREMGFPSIVAEEIWNCMVALLRQGVNVPGIKTIGSGA